MALRMQVGSESGGFEYDFVNTPPDTLICGICCFPSKNPQLSVCCGDTFCDHCIEEAKRVDGSFRCPVCRAAFSFFTNKQADRIIKDLKIFCTYKKKECDWQGEVRRISDHLMKARLRIQSNRLSQGLWSVYATENNGLARRE